jgi:predicted porin
VFVSAAWQQRKDAYSGYTIGATYKVMDGLSVMANYMSDKNKVDDYTVKSWAVGGKYTIVSGTDAILQYAQGNQDEKRKLVNLTLTHALSKRTTAYATAARGTNVGSALGNFGNPFTGGRDNTSVGLGIAHSF